MKKSIYVVILLMLTGLLVAGCAAPVPATPADPGTGAPAVDPIVIRAVSFLPRDNMIANTLWEFQKNLEELTGGRVIMEYVGGPEAIPQLDQPEAVQSGIIDLSFISSTDYVTQYPLAHTMQLSPYSPSEEREVGVYEILDQAHQKIGMKYLGRGDWLLEAYLWSSKRFDSPRDLAGETFRSLPMYDEAFNRLGINRVAMGMEEMFTAMERGMIAGFPVPSPAVIPSGLYETVDYVYSPPLWYSSLALIMNLDKWNQIPAELQALVIEAAALTEKTWVEAGQQEGWDELMQVFYDAGGQMITWTGEDAKWFTETVHGAKWDEVMKHDPENAQKLKDLYDQRR